MAKYIFPVTYVIDRNGIWLGLKKERKLQRQREQLGIGLYNGFGGLQRTGEPIEITARREVKAESGLEVLEMVKCGVALILHDYDDVEIELHFFLVTRHQGEAVESDEMIPKWFDKDKIPYNQMWPSDRHTLRKFLSGKNCIALFTINQQKALVAPPKIKIVTTLPKTIDWQSYKF